MHGCDQSWVTDAGLARLTSVYVLNLQGCWHLTVTALINMTNLCRLESCSSQAEQLGVAFLRSRNSELELPRMPSKKYLKGPTYDEELAASTSQPLVS